MTRTPSSSPGTSASVHPPWRRSYRALSPVLRAHSPEHRARRRFSISSSRSRAFFMMVRLFCSTELLNLRVPWRRRMTSRAARSLATLICSFAIARINRQLLRLGLDSVVLFTVFCQRSGETLPVVKIHCTLVHVLADLVEN